MQATMKFLIVISGFCLLLISPGIAGRSTAAAADGMTTIIVDKRGRENFTTIQSAINSVPDFNGRWIRIRLKKGTYREKINIPREKRYILLEGAGMDRTTVEWCENSPTSTSKFSMFLSKFNSQSSSNDNANIPPATLTVEANNFVARGITFKNTWNSEMERKRRIKQALAAFISGDKNAFYNCNFVGYQDTLCDFSGRHYYRNCRIEGAVDFIFGFATSIYSETTLVHTIPAPQTGWITAHAKANPDERSGFVFVDCTVVKGYTGKTYLGRAWNKYSTVVFYQTLLPDTVVPEGWEAWLAAGHTNLTTFVESDCTGPGSNMTGRVSWAQDRSPGQLKDFISITFIDNEGWLSNQP